MRKPLIFNYKFLHQYIQYISFRFKRLNLLLSQNSNEKNHFRKGLQFLFDHTADIFSVDSMRVTLKSQEYQYILSNYENQQDDVLLVQKVLPIGNQSVSDVLQGYRQLKIYLNDQQENSQKNPYWTGQIFTDIIYEAQAELFIEKFYSIIDGNIYQSILENI
ncbi:hypothetical protein ABPG72_022095 [Tetrahymena utriculariae]